MQEINPKKAWTVTIMVALFMTLNFMDKAVLGVVAPMLMAELNIPPARFGLIASSFFLFFSLSAIAFGFLATRWSTKVLLMVMAGIWGVSQFPLAFAASVPLLFVSRILLGIGEGPAYPLALASAYKWFPGDKRNLPSAVVFQGVTLGLLVAGPLLTWVVLTWSWHAAFMLLGIMSLVWMAAWAVLGKEGPLDVKAGANADAQERLSYRSMLWERTFLANMGLYWAAYWVFAVLFTWVPSYLNKVVGYDTKTTGWMFMVFTIVSVPIVLGASWLSDRMLRNGAGSTRARGTLSAVFVGLGGLLILAAIFLIQAPLAKVILLAVGCNLPQVAFTLSSTIVAEIAPTSQRAAMMSINSALATTGGLVAPAVSGWLIQQGAVPADGYRHVFAVAAFVLIAFAILGALFIDPQGSAKRLRHQGRQKATGDAALAPDRARMRQA